MGTGRGPPSQEETDTTWGWDRGWGRALPQDPNAKPRADTVYPGCVALGKSAQPLWARPAPQGSYVSTGGSTQGALAEVTRSHKRTDGRAGEWVQGQQTGALAV